MTKVSIIVPVYNVEKYLRACLDSLINQTLEDIEIICINDGSTDDSLAILQEYAIRDNRILVHSKNNEGQAIARNIGIDLANGDYIAFVDSDDFCEPRMCEELYSLAKKHDADLVECRFFMYDETTGEKTPFLKRLDGVKFDTPFNWNKIKTKSYIFNNIPGPCNKLCKLSLVKEKNIRFGMSRFAEDSYFSLRIRLLAERVVHIDRAFYVYRRRAGSITTSQKVDNSFINQPKILSETESFLRENSHYKSFRREFEKYALKQLRVVYKYISDDRKEEFIQNIEIFLGKDMKTKFYKKIGRNILKSLFSVGNKTIDNHRYKILTIFGFEIPLKKNF